MSSFLPKKKSPFEIFPIKGKLNQEIGTLLLAQPLAKQLGYFI